MFNAEPVDRRSHRLIARKLTDSPRLSPLAIGCPSCIHFKVCGGLCVEEGIFDCLDLCCGNPNRCSLVCRNKAEDFVSQTLEIDGFDLGNVVRSPAPPFNIDENIVPIIFHGSRRTEPLSHGTVALKLPDLVNYRTGELRFPTRAALCRAYMIDEGATLILSGVDRDHRIEPWWSLREKRLPIIDQIRAIGVELVTTPNFSVVLDHPRTDDLHAMARIAIVFSEFQLRGIACALHPNGRTDRDFERWSEFIRERREIRIIAYEFITGPGKKSRREYHLEKLAMLARDSGRELDIVVRGKPDVIPFLRRHFRRVIYLDAGAFMKSINRQKADRLGNQELNWSTARTEPRTPINSLFEHNAQEHNEYLKSKYYQ